MEIEGYGKDNLYSIKPEDIDSDRIYLSVELTPDVPLDRQARMNTAVIAARELKMPTADILHMLGETNPEQKIQDWMREQMTFAYLGGVLQSIQAQASGQLQQMAAQMAQQMVQQQQEQMQQMQDQAGQMGQGQEGLPPGGIEGADGMGFDPNQGGLPAQMANPGATMEQQTGFSRGGEGLA